MTRDWPLDGLIVENSILSKSARNRALRTHNPADNLERANVGAEYSLNDLFFVRAGYHINYDSDGMAYGFGAALPTGQSTKMQADYSGVDMGALGLLHRMSVTVSF